MRFTVAPAIFERFPGMRIAVVVATDVDNRPAVPAIDALWREAWVDAGRLADVYGNAQSHPRVRAWRERFRATGVSSKEFPSSIEAMLRRAFKGGEPFVVNPLVDFYNAVSLRHVVPAGGFDLAELGGLLELRLTRPERSFHRARRHRTAHGARGRGRLRRRRDDPDAPLRLAAGAGRPDHTGVAGRRARLRSARGDRASGRHGGSRRAG